MKKFLLIAIASIPLIGFSQMIPVPNGDFENPSNTSNTGAVANYAGDWFESDATDIVVDGGANKISGNYTLRIGNVNNQRNIITANAKSFTAINNHTYKITFSSRIQDAAGPSGSPNTGKILTVRAVETTDNGTTNNGVYAFLNTTNNVTATNTLTFNYNGTSPKFKIQFIKEAGIAYIDDVTLEDLGVVPVSLTNFSGTSSEVGVELTWQTAQETNNDYFEISRAGEDKNFKVLGSKSGAGTSSNTSYYSFKDNNSLKGNNYYMLKQVDFNGKTETYGPIAVKFGLLDNNLSLISSSTNKLTININSSASKEGALSLIGIDGKILSHQRVSLKSGSNFIDLTINNSYGKFGILQFTSGKERESLKVAIN